MLFFLSLCKGIAQSNITSQKNTFNELLYSDLNKAYQLAINDVLKYEKKPQADELLTSYVNLSHILYLKRNTNEAFNYCQKALKLASNTNDYEAQAEIYIRLGSIHSKRFQYLKAIKLFQKALALAEQHKLFKKKCDVYTAMGLLFQLQNNPNATAQYHKSIRLSDSIHYDVGLIQAYNALANSYIEKHNDSTELYYKRALQKTKENPNTRLFRCILTINLTYIDLTKNKNEKAKQTLLDAEKLTKEIGHDAGLFWINMFLGFYYRNTGNDQEAIHKFKLAISDYGKYVSNSRKIWAYDIIFKTYLKTKDYKNALKYKEIYYNLKDSILNIKKIRASDELKTAHEIESKNNKITLLKKEKEIEIQKRRETLYLITFIILITILLLFFFRQRIQHQKIIRKKEKKIYEKERHQLIQEKEVQKKQALIEGKNKESRRISKELHDGLGGHLGSIRLELSQINETLERPDIKKINNKLLNAVNELRELSHDLNHNYLMEKSFKILFFDLKTEYEQVHNFEIQVNEYPDNALHNLPKKLTHQLYRILQEILTNIEKHANTKLVSISFTRYSENMNIIIEDYGTGFDTNSSSKHGLGLQNIKERIEILKGKIVIDSSPSKGTHILIEIPL